MDKRLEKIIEASENVVFFGGAGVSTESNIPDFRSEEGLYNAKKEYGLTPEQMISHSFYKKNTERFFDYYKNNLIYREAKPNNAHIALAKLEKEVKLKAIVTQNIDGLHQTAGSKTVYELHGSVMRNYCSKCNTSYSLDFIMEEDNCENNVPMCPKCGGVIKPDVVLYEEALNQETIENAVRAISTADTLIVGGTSLVVYPAAGLITYFRGKNMVLINKSKTPYDDKADLVINDSIGKVMGD